MFGNGSSSHVSNAIHACLYIYIYIYICGGYTKFGSIDANLIFNLLWGEIPKERETI